MSQSCLGLVSFVSILLSIVSVLSLPGCLVFKEIKPDSESISALKVGSLLGLMKKDTEPLGLVSVSPKIFS